MQAWFKAHKFAALAAIATGVAIPVVLSFSYDNPLFIAAVPVAVLFFVIMSANPLWALAILLFLRALLDPVLDKTKVSFFGEATGIGGVLNLLAIGLAMLLVFAKFAEWRKGMGIFKWWLLFLAVSLAAVVYSPVPARALKLYLNLASCFMMFAAGFVITRNDKDIKFWIKLIVLSSIAPALLCVAGVASGGRWFYRQTVDAGARLEGTFTHPNILAFYLLFVFVVLFYILKSGYFNLRRPHRVAIYIYMAVLAVLMLFTKTRGAWIGCWTVFFLYGFLKEKKFIAVSVVLPVVALALPPVRERVLDLLTGNAGSGGGGGPLNSFAWRLKLWQSSLGPIKQCLWKGHGLASFEELSRQFFTMGRHKTAAHNTFIEILFECGIPGLVSYFMIFWALVRKFLGRYPLVAAYVASYVLVSVADNMLYYLAFNWYFWFFMGLMLAKEMRPVEKL
jgi:O-antigen ligase